ncbi:MAG TPA: hypothetical protein VF283_17530 [Bryobacteraceae bacterium]
MPIDSLITIALTVCAFIAGLYAARLWLMASKIGPEPGWAVEPADEMLSQMGWVSALIEASVKSGELNRRAAKWTAVAVLLGTISSVLSNLP